MVVIIRCMHVLMSVEKGFKLKFLSCITHLHQTGSLKPATFNHSAALSRLLLASTLLLCFVTSFKINSHYHTFSVLLLDFPKLGGIPEDNSCTFMNTNKAL